MTQGGGRKVVSVGNYMFTGKKLGKGNFARVDEAIHTMLNVKVGKKLLLVTLCKSLVGQEMQNFAIHCVYGYVFKVQMDFPKRASLEIVGNIHLM